jgi:DNA mismatch endonuclease, patch repair protein
LPDVVDKATRSRMMAGIKGKNTRPEIAVRKALHAEGFRFRLHHKGLPGKPDIVLPKHKAVVFVHGCFWHGHECPEFRWPKTRPAFWRKKITNNHNRDIAVSESILATGWRVFTVWECVLKCEADAIKVSIGFKNWLQSNRKTKIMESKHAR